MADNQHYVIDDGQNKIPGYSKEETDAAIDAAASNLTNIAGAYDDTATYAVGDYCIYNNQLYKCNTAISTPEAFNPNHWTSTDVSAELENIFSNLNNKVNKTPTTFSITPATGITIQYQRCCIFGELKFISVYFAASSSAGIQVGTIPNEAKGKGTTFFPLCKQGGSNGYVYLATNSSSLQGDSTIGTGNYTINGFYW
jgi:hypothetical protein